MVRPSKPLSERVSTIEDRFRVLTSRLDGAVALADHRHDEVLITIDQALSRAEAPAAAATVASSSLVPGALPHGEPTVSLPRLHVSEVFDWIPGEVVEIFKTKKFTVDDFLKLRKPDSGGLARPTKRTRFALVNGKLEAEEAIDEPLSTARFMAVVPNLGALMQLWSTYTALAVHHSDEPKDLAVALCKFGQEVAQLDDQYTWSNVCAYFMAVAAKRFNRADAKAWTQPASLLYLQCLWERRH